MSIVVAPSILSADPARFGEEIRSVEAAGADWIHVDVMDGHFVPNLTFGPPVIKGLRKATKLPFDVHLMIEQPERSIDAYIDAGANWLTVHAEASTHLHRTLSAIRARNVKAGVSLNPHTPLNVLDYVLPMVDLVLIMSVNPGFGGQKFIPEVLPKIQRLKQQISAQNLSTLISVDGGVDASQIPALAKVGADVFVAGSAIFGTSNYTDAVRSMRQAAP